MVRSFLLLVSLSLLAQPSDSVQSFLNTLNYALKGDSAELGALFTPDAEYRVGDRIAARGPESIADILIPPAFSEQTRPLLQRPSVYPFSGELVLVGADMVAYGSLLPKRSSPVVILLRRTGAGWRIVRWRVPITPLFPGPASRR